MNSSPKSLQELRALTLYYSIVIFCCAVKASNKEVMESMKKVYKAKIRPLEQKYKFDYFMSGMNDGDFDSRPMVLLLV